MEGRSLPWHHNVVWPLQLNTNTKIDHGIPDSETSNQRSPAEVALQAD